MLYFLFAANDFYECGGVHDYVGAFRTLEEAQAVHTVCDTRSAHIAIVEDGELRIISEAGGWLPEVEGEIWRAQGMLDREWHETRRDNKGGIV